MGMNGISKTDSFPSNHFFSDLKIKWTTGSNFDKTKISKKKIIGEAYNYNVL